MATRYLMLVALLSALGAQHWASATENQAPRGIIVTGLESTDSKYIAHVVSRIFGSGIISRSKGNKSLLAIAYLPTFAVEMFARGD